MFKHAWPGLLLLGLSSGLVSTAAAEPAAAVPGGTESGALQVETVAAPTDEIATPFLGVAPGLFGAAGPLRLRTAGSLRPGSVGLGFWGQFLTQDSLIIENDNETRTKGSLVALWAPLDFLEASLGFRWSSNYSEMTSPHLVQSQGDLLLGVKGFSAIPGAAGLSAGGMLTLDALTGEGDVFWDPAATSVRLAGLLTWEAWRASPSVPLRVHGNLGYSFENSANLSDRDLRPVESFAHDALAFDTVDLGIGLEAVFGAIVPFVEWNLRIPVSTRSDSDEVCIPTEKCPGDEGFPSFPHWLTLGLRGEVVTGLNLSAALDLGLTQTVVTGVPAIPPYNLVFGLSYAFDPTPRVEVRTVEKVVTKEVGKPLPTGVLRGKVVDKITRQPISNAIINYPGAGRTAQASATDGGFESYPFPPGTKLRIEIAAEPNYQSKAFQIELKDGPVEFAFSLEASLREMEITGRVHDLDDMPVAGAQVLVVGTEGVVTTDPASGQYTLKLKPGKYRIRATGTNSLSRERDVEVKVGERQSVDFMLRPKEKLMVVFKDNKLELKRPIHFALGRADIQPDSFFILDQVIDQVVAHDVKRLRIEGHTDSDGNPALNLKLSQDRANAVKAYLVREGIDPARLDAQGFGPNKPIAPNKTPAGKAMNRRVEFHVLDEGSGGTPPATQPQPPGSATPPPAAPAQVPGR